MRVSSELSIDPEQVWSQGKHPVAVKARSLLSYWAVRKLGAGATELSKFTTAVRGSQRMAQMTSYERYRLLHRAAQLMEERIEEFAHTITIEEGKILAEARIEAARSCEIINLPAEEAKRLYGETIPLDGGPGVRGKFGFTVRGGIGH